MNGNNASQNNPNNSSTALMSSFLSGLGRAATTLASTLLDAAVEKTQAPINSTGNSRATAQPPVSEPSANERVPLRARNIPIPQQDMNSASSNESCCCGGCGECCIRVATCTWCCK